MSKMIDVDKLTVEDLKKLIEEKQEGEITAVKADLAQALKVVSDLQNKLALLTGKSVSVGKRTRKPSPAINVEDVDASIKSAGKSGIKGPDLAAKLGVTPLEFSAWFRRNKDKLKHIKGAKTEDSGTALVYTFVK